MINVSGEILTARIQAVPKLGRFLEAAEDLLGREKSVNLSSLVTQFSEIATPALTSAILLHELVELSQDSSYYPPATSDRVLTIARNQDFSLALVKVSPISGRPVLLQAYARNSLIANVSDTPVQFTLYQQSSPDDSPFIDPTKTLRLDKSQSLECGDHVNLLAGRDVIELKPISESVLLVLQSRPIFDYSWVYDSTLAPIMSEPSDIMETRIVYLLNVVKGLRHPDLLDGIIEVFDHPSGRVRLSALQAAMNIDKEDARNLCVRAALDNCTLVANAATQYIAARENER